MLFPERGSGGEVKLLAFRGFDPQAAQFWEWVDADSKCPCGIALRDKRRVVAPDVAGCDFMAETESCRQASDPVVRNILLDSDWDHTPHRQGEGTPFLVPRRGSPTA